MRKEDLNFFNMKELLLSVDLTTGCLVQDEKGRLVFLAQEKDDWTRKDNVIRIPFGGIGGKVEVNETPLIALKREITEEITGGLQVETAIGNITFCDNLGNFLPSNLDFNELIKKRFPDDIKPQLIIANIYNDTNYPNFRPSLIGVYRATFRGSISPAGENPYLLYLPYPLLIYEYKQGFNLNDIIQQGGKITANPDLRQQLSSLLVSFFPIGDARILAILGERGIFFR